MQRPWIRESRTAKAESHSPASALSTWKRYWLFQLPGIAFVAGVAALGTIWFRLPDWTVPLAVALWVVKDLLLYPFVGFAYEGSKPSGPESMVGAVGTATEDFSSGGFVKIGPELWRAESAAPVRAGGIVRVTGCDGMTLRVEAVKQEDRHSLRPGGQG